MHAQSLARASDICFQVLVLDSNLTHSARCLVMFPAHAVAPNASTTFNGRVFSYYRILRRWDDANITCKALGANLATVRDTSELSQLWSLALQKDAWVGGHTKGSLPPTNKTNWEWVGSPGQAVATNLWGQWEPSGDGLCGHLSNFSNHNGSLNDQPCQSSFAYICETLAPT